MYEKTTNSCFLVQRYGELFACANPFNESPLFFSKAAHLYFVSILQAGILVQMDDFFVKTRTQIWQSQKKVFPLHPKTVTTQK